MCIRDSLEVGLFSLGDVDNFVPQEVQNLGDPVRALGQGEELGCLLNEGGIARTLSLIHI